VVAYNNARKLCKFVVCRVPAVSRSTIVYHKYQRN